MKEVLKLALEALEPDPHVSAWVFARARNQAITALREALAEQPPQRTWVGLTDKEAMQICVDCGCLSEDWLTFLDAIEVKLRSKNA